MNGTTKSNLQLVDIPWKADADRLEAVYRARAIQLAKPAVASASSTALQVIVFALGTERYGLEITDVAEIVRRASIEPVPGAPPHLAGVINLRGEIRPVLNLRHLLGMQPDHTGGSAWVLLLRQRVGLQVDRLQDVRPLRPGELQRPNERGADIAAPYLKGSVPGAFMLLNASALFAGLAGEFVDV